MKPDINVSRHVASTYTHTIDSHSSHLVKNSTTIYTEAPVDTSGHQAAPATDDC